MPAYRNTRSPSPYAVPMSGDHRYDSSVQVANSTRPITASQAARERTGGPGAAAAAIATSSQAISPAQARGPSKYPPEKNASAMGPASSTNEQT